MFGEPIKAAHKFQVSKEVTDLSDDSKPANSNKHKFAWAQGKFFYKLKIARAHGSYRTNTAGTHDSSERTTAAAWTVTVRIPT
jgi:hypothetical protein